MVGEMSEVRAFLNGTRTANEQRMPRSQPMIDRWNKERDPRLSRFLPGATHSEATQAAPTAESPVFGGRRFNEIDLDERKPSPIPALQPAQAVGPS